MKRISLIFVTLFLGSLFFYQFRAVFSQNQPPNNPSIQSKSSIKIIDLGTLGGESSQAADLNDKGEVVGSSELPTAEKSQAFRWFTGTISPLTTPDDLATNVYAINESGAIAGETISGDGSEQEMLPALWIGNAFTSLPIIEGSQGSARAINEAGLIAGHTISQVSNHILLWETNTITETIPVDGGLAQVNSLNNQNQIVGLIHDRTSNRAFLWEDGSFEELGTLGGQNSIAYDIDDQGKIVGTAAIEEDLATHAFLWHEGVMTDLGDVPNATSRALGINESGIIVGEAQVGDVMHAVAWEDGQIIDLNTLLPAESEWELLSTAVSINDKGWIVGTGLIAGNEHAFLLVPSSPEFLSYLPFVAKNLVAPTPTPTATASPSPTPSPTSTPMPNPTPSIDGYDLARYLTGDGRLYEVHFKAGDFETRARHQTQFSGSRFYHTKGNEEKAEWEEIWNDDFYIYRGTDTSPGYEKYYTLYGSMEDYLAGKPGSHWSERYMEIGDMYFRQPYVVFFNKDDCSLAAGGYSDPSWLKFQAFHETYTFETGFTLNDVVELAWMQGDQNGPTQPVDERYFYAEGYGLVGWKKPSLGWRSAIDEEHPSGERPDNTREEIACINNIQFTPQSWNPKLNTGPLPEPYASMVKP